MKSIYIGLIIILFQSLNSYAQHTPDTVINLRDIKIQPYYADLTKASSAFNRLDSNTLTIQGFRSQVRSFNFIPGVQMEERSPASYRLSIRGSLIRSPFGIRNLKIYLADYPLTDASGNTYLNLIDPAFIQDAIILKGPQSSHLGANIGGSILFESVPNFPNTKEQIKLNHNKPDSSIYNSKSTYSKIKTYGQMGLEGGSFNELHQYIRLQSVGKLWRSNFFQSWQQSDGYRENSAMDRLFIQFNGDINYHKSAVIKVFTFFSKLNYQTPGGLTKSQMELNPRSARPATSFLPGAVEQKAGIFNQSYFFGLNHIKSFSSYLSWNIASSFMLTSFKNPFITNYESRNEQNYNIRTYLNDQRNWGKLHQQIYLGYEGAIANSEILNTENLKGLRGKTLAQDDIKVNSSFAFLRGIWDFNKKVNIEAGLSINWYKTQFNKWNDIHNTTSPQVINKPLIAPKLAISYSFIQEQVLFASINKGFSSPTIAELRPSNMQINYNLNAENAWNNEIGWRLSKRNEKIQTSVIWYSLNLRNAIVRQLDNQEQEFFINAGAVKQSGLEFSLRFPIWEAHNPRLIKSIIWEGNYQYQHYRFKNYSSSGKSFNGNKLTGSPSHKWNMQIQFNLIKDIHLLISGYAQSEVPLNDDNTIFAKSYNIFDGKISFNQFGFLNHKFTLYLGVNNLLNNTYSLGPDLNAIGSRFYNPAPLRNMYMGIQGKF